MKRILGIVVSLLLILGLVGCKHAEPVFNESDGSLSVTDSDIVQLEEIQSTATTSRSHRAGSTDTAAHTTEKDKETTTSSTTKQAGSESTAATTSGSHGTGNTGTAAHTTEKDKETTTSSTTKRTGNESATTTAETSSVDKPSSMELKNLGSLQYYLYTPRNPVSGMPLIVYLHGGTNKKAAVSALLTSNGFPQHLNEGYYGDLRAYVVIPKLDNRYQGWADIDEQIRDLITAMHTNCGIDMNRISLTGHSMGGTGTYQLQVKLPGTFACIAPASGSIQNNETNLTALRQTKVWAFVGTNDTIVSPDSSRSIIQALQEKGADATITELDGASHFEVPALAYKSSGLIEWLVNGG